MSVQAILGAPCNIKVKLQRAIYGAKTIVNPYTIDKTKIPDGFYLGGWLRQARTQPRDSCAGLAANDPSVRHLGNPVDCRRHLQASFRHRNLEAGGKTVINHSDGRVEEVDDRR